MQTVLGVAGAVVGSFFGYPQLGFLLGSLVGVALTPKTKTEGPKLDDLKVTVSTYGAGIPTLEGNGRIGGNVIWSTDRIEIPTTQSSGKGGGTENTTYQYFVHMAIALCYGEIAGIRKVWRDGKLVYDSSTGMSINAALASSSSPFTFATLYYGTETQLPDPIQEVYLGAGNVPAYRGIAYIQLNIVECPGGRIPQFSFEVTMAASKAQVKQVFGVPPAGVGTRMGYVRADSAWHMNSSASGGIVTTEQSYVAATGVAKIGILHPHDLPLPIPGADSPSAIVQSIYGSDHVIDILDLQTGTIVRRIYSGSSFPNLSNTVRGDESRVAAWPPSNKIAVMMTDNSITRDLGIYHDVNGYLLSCATVTGTTSGIGIDATSVYVLIENGGSLYLSVHSVDDGSQTDIIAGPAVSTFSHMRSTIYVGDSGVVYALIVTGASQSIQRIDTASGAWTTISSNATSTGGFRISDRSTFFANDQYALLGPDDNTGEYTFIRFQVLSPSAVKVKDVISRQCLRAGLLSGQFDVTGIPDSDLVWGYVMANPASARSNIQPLLTAYAIDATEEDGKLRFFKRANITSVVTVPYAELGCVEIGGDPGDPMPLSRGQEAELPASVAVSYLDPSFDYQSATQTARRQATTSQADQTVEIAIASDADHMASVAEMILYDAWNERNRRSFSVPRKYAFVSPGDGVTFTFVDGTHQLWRITKATDTGLLIQWEGVPAQAALYTVAAQGADAAGRGQEVQPLGAPTRIEIMDTPILRDADSDAGPYVALSGYGTGWPGAELFVGSDAASLVTRGAVENEAPSGYAETALGDFQLGTVDETNLVTVNVTHHTLSSVTRSVMLTGTQNVAAIGANGRWEIVKFQRADSLGSGRYILSGLMRGQRGTEWAASLHQVGDTFVLLSMAGMLRVNGEPGSVGQSQIYKAVTKGRSDGDAKSYTNTGEGLKPLSPTGLRKAVASNDITLTWSRRTRLSENWLTGVLPLGEASERYELEVYSSSSFSTVKRVLDAFGSRSVTYTAAQQTEDFGAPQSTIYVRVYQMSDAIGRGRALQATI